jgi:hypothetical protein
MKAAQVPERRRAADTELRPARERVLDVDQLFP